MENLKLGGEMSDSEPIIVHCKEIRPFPFIKIKYFIEDRHPDLEYYEEGKYKNFIYINILWKSFRWTFRTNYLYSDLPYS